MSNASDTAIQQQAAAAHAVAETALARLAPAADTAPVRLHAAMRHSLLAPGKRVRPILAILSAEQFGSSASQVAAAAVAVEMVHASSLILDDLPAMDNATLRRGRPTNHQMFGDDTAMLASIGLMNLAYDVVANDRHLTPEQVARIVGVLSRSIGSEGLIAGQEEDLHGLPEDADPEASLATMHRRKTGALFAAAAEIGGICANQATAVCADLNEFGMRLGHAFQTLDDLLDAVTSSEAAGKDTGVDGDKPTLVAMHGRDVARAAALSQLADALDVLPGGANTPLGHYANALTEMLMSRLSA